MRIVLTGGGSGGHITPILAIANELKKIEPRTRVIYIGQKGDSLADVPATHAAIDEVFTVRAGKFRRYHGEGLWQVFDILTQLKNLRDFVWVLIGICQSFWLLRRLKPDLIFTRGGFVSVPVALGGKLNDIPYITHDSDSTPSLANRAIARWAALHIVALPVELYPYPRSKTVTIGIPLRDEYTHVTPDLMRTYREETGLAHFDQILFVTGGGNGATQLNQVVIDNAPSLLEHNPGLGIVHLSGRSNEAATNKLYDARLTAKDRTRVMVMGHVTDMYRYSGAADAIVARGGATGLAEFALQGKACVIIPAKQLVWQIHHVRTLQESQAVICLSESESEKKGAFIRVVDDLLHDEARRQKLGESLARFAHPHAAEELAMVLLKEAQEGANGARENES